MFQGTKTEDAKLVTKCWFQTQVSPKKLSKQTNKQKSMKTPHNLVLKSRHLKKLPEYEDWPWMFGVMNELFPLDILCLVGFPANCLVKGVTMSDGPSPYLVFVEALVVLIVFHWLVVFARNFDEKSCLVIQIGELQLVTRLVSSRQKVQGTSIFITVPLFCRHFCQWNHTHWRFQLRYCSPSAI